MNEKYKNVHIVIKYLRLKIRQVFCIVNQIKDAEFDKHLEERVCQLWDKFSKEKTNSIMKDEQ